MVRSVTLTFHSMRSFSTQLLSGSTPPTSPLSAAAAAVQFSPTADSTDKLIYKTVLKDKTADDAET